MGGKPLARITLPVCPICNRASATMMSTTTGKHYCIGPVEARHAQVAMEVRSFVEDRSGDGGR